MSNLYPAAFPVVKAANQAMSCTLLVLFRMRILLLALSVTTAISLFPVSAQAQVNVVTTVRPLELIARAIVGDQGQVRAIIDAQDSPHHFTLSPGDRLAVEAADLLLWIGPEFEVFLERFFQRQQARPRVTVLTLTDLVRHSLADGSIDPHVWLDPVNAIHIARSLATRLSELDANHAQAYQANYERFADRIGSLQSQLESTLAVYRDLDYAVYHNAYQYFEQRFGLSHGLALVSNPEVAPGMRQTLMTRSELVALAPACVLLEPDYNPDLLNTLLNGRDIKQVPVDPLGYALSTSDDSYPALLESIAAAFADCAN